MTERYLNTEQAKQLAIHWARTEPLIRIVVASAIGHGQAVDDIVQEVATIVTEKFEDYDPDQPFSNWAIGITKNRIAKTIRSKVRDRHVFSGEMIEALADITAELQPEADLRKAALAHCLEVLKGRSRSILEMRYQWGRQVQSIAEDLGMTRVAVSGVLLRARKALGQCIEARLRKEDQA